MKTFAGLVVVLLFGAAMAFFKPAEPIQVKNNNENAIKPTFLSPGQVDDLLDNPNIVTDSKITPARKCGFCMG